MLLATCITSPPSPPLPDTVKHPSIMPVAHTLPTGTGVLWVVVGDPYSPPTGTACVTPFEVGFSENTGSPAEAPINFTFNRVIDAIFAIDGQLASSAGRGSHMCCFRHPLLPPSPPSTPASPPSPLPCPALPPSALLCPPNLPYLAPFYPYSTHIASPRDTLTRSHAHLTTFRLHPHSCAQLLPSLSRVTSQGRDASL